MTEFPRSEADLRSDMGMEATRIEFWGRTWDATYRKRAHQWSLWSAELAVTAAVLAAAAGATGLGELLGTLGPGLLALAASVVSGVAGALGAATRATQYNTAAAADSGLSDAARAFRTAVVNDLPITEVRREFDALCKRRDAVVNSAPVSSRPLKLSQEQLAAWPPGSEPSHTS